jgi:hypothetical protein
MLPYDLYNHRGWVNRQVESVRYVGDLLWEFRISVDINQKTLKE